MTDYIRREDAIVAYANHEVDVRQGKFEDFSQYMRNVLRSVESADVAPIRRGHWIKHEGRNGAKDSIECSACGVWIDDMPRKTFCPNCGSIMYRYGGNND